MMFRTIVAALAALVVFGGTHADAHSRHRHRHHAQQQVAKVCVFFDFACRQPAPRPEPVHRVHAVAAPAAQTQIVAHPEGCPHIAFCGCGASMYLFHRIVPGLMAARRWLDFPPAAPAPHMAAVRPHHVFVLIEHEQGEYWKVYEANWGHMTRVWVRSIAGYSIRDPGAGNMRFL